LKPHQAFPEATQARKGPQLGLAKAAPNYRVSPATCSHRRSTASANRTLIHYYTNYLDFQWKLQIYKNIQFSPGREAF